MKKKVGLIETAKDTFKYGCYIVLFLLFCWAMIEARRPHIVRLEDGHQYVKVENFDDGVDIEHLAGCDHVDHKKE